jgi:TIR domain
MEPKMSQLSKFFITHSWKDIGFAQRLSDDLNASGLKGFFDMYSIEPGDDIAMRINKGLEECDVYIPILSFAALESPWCKEEINAALTLSN